LISHSIASAEVRDRPRVIGSITQVIHPQLHAHRHPARS
jgi:hypothetical protein